jgi:hypothetical protein
VIGVVLVLLGMFVVGPIGVFAVGLVWSALHGWLESEDADERAQTTSA